MSTGGLIEKGAVALVHRAAGLTMALAPARKEQVQTVARVVAVRDLGTATRRLTIAADTLRTFERSGPDEYVGLLMPERGARLVMPADRPDPRAAVAAMPEGERPALRWYTIRAHRPEAGEIDVDVVRHGDSGPVTPQRSTGSSCSSRTRQRCPRCARSRNGSGTGRAGP